MEMLNQILGFLMTRGVLGGLRSLSKVSSLSLATGSAVDASLISRSLGPQLHRDRKGVQS